MQQFKSKYLKANLGYNYHPDWYKEHQKLRKELELKNNNFIP